MTLQIDFNAMANMVFLAISHRALVAAAALALAFPMYAQTTPSGQPADQPTSSDVQRQWSAFGQFTNVTQKHNKFHAPYGGANSLAPDGRAEETSDLTFYAGARLWEGAEAWINPEVDQGFGLSGTLGAAGFPSGEAYKIGANAPYLRLPRLFARQYIRLGGARDHVEGAANQFAYESAADSLTITVGKFSVVDIFDANRYAHDPRGDFMNWALIDAGTFDYAADAWGFTYGGAAELSLGPWSLRGGVFQLSPVPNGKVTGVAFGQRSWVGEIERRYEWAGRPGKLRVLGFVNEGRMGTYAAAAQLGSTTDSTPSTALVRRYRSRPGASASIEQQISSELGAFARAGVNNGRFEAYEFTEINRTLSAGLVLSGVRWGRPDDKVGVGMVVNGLSGDARRYFAAGGLGILIGDGRLSYSSERVVELYYSFQLSAHVTLAIDVQRLENPAYNRDRGPVSVFGTRVHVEI